MEHYPLIPEEEGLCSVRRVLAPALISLRRRSPKRGIVPDRRQVALKQHWVSPSSSAPLQFHQPRPSLVPVAALRRSCDSSALATIHRSRRRCRRLFPSMRAATSSGPIGLPVSVPATTPHCKRERSFPLMPIVYSFCAAVITTPSNTASSSTTIGCAA